MHIENIDWQITSKCNRECLYCFGPKRCQEMSLHEALKVVDIFKSIGVKQIGITGGEPLLYPYIRELISYIHDMGISIYLSTNCDFFNKYFDLIYENISIIGIPIDGPNAQIHDAIRGKSSFISATNALQKIFQAGGKTKIKIGTVISKPNYKALGEIEQLIAHYESKLIYWKLYHLISYPHNAEGVRQLIPPCHNSEFIHTLGTKIPKSKIINDTLSIRSQSYFFVRPDGNVFIPILNKMLSEEHFIGNILVDEIDAIVKTFETYVNPDGYSASYRYMRTTDG